ncbi:CHASE2 domain-containing protein [Phormidium sp. CLA17]|uniref:serine/threonine-protein kinase n=1 Tax=Leptolyngbya sp. Cla-17 TaxID=2803751 RepID=UPI001492CF92|nr:serine/threonine-protein kinase [Leptolyngbya sp. Cla-17]MBM0740447.1 CHASE2 domain-containing protein [Leptolyngbya sp. Cla-17]
MSQESSHPQAKTLIAESAGFKRLLRNFVSRRLATLRQINIRDASNVGHGLLTICAVTAGLSVAGGSTSQFLDRQVQSRFFNLRGTVIPPSEVIIVKIDEYSNSQARSNYAVDSKKYAYLEPLTTAPWKRAAYAQAIDRLMSAGAKSVAVDLIFDTPSSHGIQDDLRLQKTLQRYAGRVTLPVLYAEDTLNIGLVHQIISPQEIFQTQPSSMGSINYPTEANDKIHALPSEYPRRVEFDLAQAGNPQDAKIFARMASQYPSFAQAALNAGKLTYQPPKGENIFFYGPTETFTQVSFWELLDPETWKNHRRNKTFEGKLVLIGPTGEPYKDFHSTPFGIMQGVEVNANSIATLLENRSISTAIPSLPAQGVFVVLLVLFAGYVQSHDRKVGPLRRFGTAIVLALGWISISYSVFVAGRLILPTAMPVVAIVLSGASYLITGITSEKLQQQRANQQRRQALQQHGASQDVKNFIYASGDSDLRGVMDEQNQDIIGKTLDGRYKVLKEIGSGGFGKTYRAQDTNRPKNPLCVVKQLRPVNTKPRAIELAKKLFKREAEVLERLGIHDQIPRLLTYREDEFYLVQDYIKGESLQHELFGSHSSGRLPERKVVDILQDLLQVLKFVHDHGVIHRDIKPANIIRRQADGKLVLIDFGAVKEIEQQIEQVGDTQSIDRATVAIGTDGFMAPEQAHGRPRLSSDIYSVGIVGILALTGLSAKELNQKRDPSTDKFQWKENIRVSHALAEILDKMVSSDHFARYQSATDALAALKPLFENTKHLWEQTNSTEDASPQDPTEMSLEETRAWPDTFSALQLSDTDPAGGSIDNSQDFFSCLLIAITTCFNRAEYLDRPSKGLLLLKVLLHLLRSPHRDRDE